MEVQKKRSVIWWDSWGGRSMMFWIVMEEEEEEEEEEGEMERKRTDLDLESRSIQRQARTLDEHHFIAPMIQLVKE